MLRSKRTKERRRLRRQAKQLRQETSMLIDLSDRHPDKLCQTTDYLEQQMRLSKRINDPTMYDRPSQTKPGRQVAGPPQNQPR
jgi:hypothetical protein